MAIAAIHEKSLWVNDLEYVKVISKSMGISPEELLKLRAEELGFKTSPYGVAARRRPLIESTNDQESYESLDHELRKINNPRRNRLNIA
ncbi:MAG: hypothetical protein Q8P81_02855 [Nanoarchaeota archaeon]|nr:hypothetical protein [Nanoarchaeota archaeon]